ncbi:transposase [Streptomyces hygroscopicus]|uniref:transposase n=1 Tax=Streptomyces hygroscopicus TaxID=1912 RepID=UPI0033D2AEA7
MVDHGGVVRRHDLTDHEWELPAPLIPRASTGRPRVEDRRLINGMVYKIRTGISWRDLLTLGEGFAGVRGGGWPGVLWVC